MKIQTGTVVARVEEIFDEVKPGDKGGTRQVRGVKGCPKQLDPDVRVQNRRVSGILKEKLMHLNTEEREVMKQTLME
jgi:hypothetical protein